MSLSFFVGSIKWMKLKLFDMFIKERSTRHVPGDVRAQEFWLINRFSEAWKSLHHIDHTTKGESLNSKLPFNINISRRKDSTDE